MTVMTGGEAAAAAVRPDFSAAELVAVTGTQYNNPDDPRSLLSLRNAELLRDAGEPLVVVDSSNDERHPQVAAAHEALGATVLRAEVGGIATQRQEGVAFAVQHGAKKVQSAEPEKFGLAGFKDQIAEALETADVLVIGRTQAAEDSLPPVQQRTERLAGWLLERALQLPPDCLSGGRAFTVAGAEVLADYDALGIDPITGKNKNNWLYLYDVALEARKRGLRAGHIAVDLYHPEEMVAEETNNPAFDKKRFDQFELQIDYLLSRRLTEMEGSHPDRELVQYAVDMTRLMQGTSMEFRSMVMGQMERFFADHAFSDGHFYVPAERLVAIDDPLDPARSQQGIKATRSLTGYLQRMRLPEPRATTAPAAEVVS